jgi:hypothetical protein
MKRIRSSNVVDFLQYRASLRSSSIETDRRTHDLHARSGRGKRTSSHRLQMLRHLEDLGQQAERQR